MKEVMKIIDTLTQENFHRAFEKLLERYNKCIAAGGAYIECSSRSHVEYVTITNIIIKIPDRKYDWGVNYIMPGSDGLGILVIFQKSSKLRFDAGRG